MLYGVTVSVKVGGGTVPSPYLGKVPSFHTYLQVSTSFSSSVSLLKLDSPVIHSVIYEGHERSTNRVLAYLPK